MKNKKICYAKDCDREVKARGLCNKHLQRLVDHGDIYFVSRCPIGASLKYRLDFYSKKVGDCIIWTGSKTPTGYGRLCYQGKNLSAHRASYVVYKGKIKDSLHVLHTCDNPSCINPDHLYTGTHQDNMRDREDRGRGVIQYGEKSNFSTLTEKQVVSIKNELKDGASLKYLSEKYNVTPQNIWFIKTGKTWKHLN